MSSDILTAITQTVDAKLTKFEQKINNLPEEINKHYKTCADATKANLPKEKDDNPTNFKYIVMEAIEEKNSEKKKEEDRKKNITLFNMLESEKESIEERKRFDHSFFDKKYNHGCDTGLPTGTVAQVRRLGKRLNKDSKRPLLITVCDENDKRQPFVRLYKLNNALEYIGISVSHDMTKDERLNTKLLVEKAKERSKNENVSKNWIFKVRRPPWEQRIVKLPIQHPN